MEAETRRSANHHTPRTHNHNQTDQDRRRAHPRHTAARTRNAHRTGPALWHRPAFARRRSAGVDRRDPARAGGTTMLTIPLTTKLWFASAVDLRLGFDGLANLVRTQLSADPTLGHLFVFTNRSANRVKVLYWGGHGYCLWCTRLEAGRYHFPQATAAGIELSAAQFAMILDGIDTSRVRRFKRFSPPSPESRAT